ncbi:MAG: PAS domain S-box protein, partial [Chloroflexi bacterium]|nr:PAS domain S-box protein [Chloroflexota bacterium]
MDTTPSGDRPAAVRGGAGETGDRLDLAERLRILVDRGLDLVYRYRLVPERGFEYVSPAATVMTGYSPEDHYADPDLGLKLVHPDDRHLLEAAAAGRTSDPLVLRWVRRDGSILWTEQHNVPVVDASGTLVAIEGMARDVTVREETLHALRASEARFRTLLERVDLIAFVLDPMGRVTFANRAFLGAVRLGDGGADGTDWFEEFVAPERRATLRATIEADVAGGKANRSVVTDLVAADGSRRLVHLHVIGLPGPDGSLTALAAIGDDLTAIDEQVSRSARLAAAIEQTTDAVIITDTLGDIQYVNPAFERVTGFAYEEAVGQNPRILKSGRQSDRFYRRMWRTLASGAPWRGELTNRRKDGTLFIEEASITPIVGPGGRV